MKLPITGINFLQSLNLEGEMLRIVLYYASYLFRFACLFVLLIFSALFTLIINLLILYLI